MDPIAYDRINQSIEIVSKNKLGDERNETPERRLHTLENKSDEGSDDML